MSLLVEIKLRNFGGKQMAVKIGSMKELKALLSIVVADSVIQIAFINRFL